MGICNSLDTFQEKMNEILFGFEFIRAYIDNLLIITKGDWYRINPATKGYISAVIPPGKVNPAEVGTGNPGYILLWF